MDNAGEAREWLEARQLVLAEIKRLNQATTALTEQVIDLRVELATLTTTVQIKSGVWGAIAGMIPALGMLIFYLLTK